MFLLKKYDINLNEDESYKSIVDEILKNNISCYTKYISCYCSNHQNKTCNFQKSI